MKGKTVLLTGGTSGIGKETVIGLAKMGAKVIFTARNEDKGRNTEKEVRQLTGNDTVEFMFLELSKFGSVKQFADYFCSKYDHLDVLLNNAGTWLDDRKENENGIELTLATNHLGPFLLTNLLLDLLKASAPSRIVSVSSALHPRGVVNFEDLESKNDYKGMQVYSTSKLMNVYFTKSLAKRLEGTGVTANCLHPGLVNTGLFTNAKWYVKAILGLFMLSPEKGAKNSIFVASDPSIKGISGEYFVKQKIEKSSPQSYDMDIAERLWKVSEAYVREYLHPASSDTAAI